jgi:hypothetical protein
MARKKTFKGGKKIILLRRRAKKTRPISKTKGEK